VCEASLVLGGFPVGKGKDTHVFAGLGMAWLCCVGGLPMTWGWALAAMGNEG